MTTRKEEKIDVINRGRGVTDFKIVNSHLTSRQPSRQRLGPQIKSIHTYLPVAESSTLQRASALVRNMYVRARWPDSHIHRNMQQAVVSAGMPDFGTKDNSSS